MIIELKNINKVYGKNENRIIALNNISLKINKGDFISIMGPSGCGKSTLLNILGCIDIPQSGEYYLEGNNIEFKKINSLSEIRNYKVGMIFQNFALLKQLTVQENCLVPLKFRKDKNKVKYKLVETYLKKLDLFDYKDKKVINLSGGQQQRVAIARTLIQETDIILADEPTGALDEENSKNIMDILTMLNKEFNKTIIVVTHDKLVGSYTNKILFMKDGNLIE